MKRIRNKVCAGVAGMLTAVVALGFLPATTQEVAHDYAYYAAMSDYAVYTEYCQRFGYTPKESLPEDFRDFPGRFYLNAGMRCYGGCMDRCEDDWCPWCRESVWYLFLLTGDLEGVRALGNPIDPALLGLPEGVMVYAEMCTDSTCESMGEHMEVEICFETGSQEYVDSIPDVYRALLSVYDSTLVKEYAQPLHDSVPGGFCLGTHKAGGAYLIRGKVARVSEEYASATDASVILQYTAAAGNGQAPQWCMMRQYIADINGDKEIDAADASLILWHASVLGNGGQVDWYDLYM